MGHLESISTDDLRDELLRLDDGRQARRLVVALLYRYGHSGPAIADLFDVREATVYAWLDRFEAADGAAEAAADRPRPGRPPKLTPAERATFHDALEEPPEAVGWSADSWTPEAAREYLASEFGVDYSLRHVRRLLAEADERR